MMSVLLGILVSSQQVLSEQAEEEAKKDYVYLRASQTYVAFNKSIKLTISPKILNQTHLESMWYVDYVKMRNESTVYTGLYDPYLTLVTIMQKGVYFKKLKESWRYVSPEKEDYSHMDILFELPESVNITAARLVRNSSIVAVAYSNLTVEIIDIRKVREEDSGRFSYTSFIMDTTYKFGTEETHKINSIGHIPASDFIVFSSNRFEILKADLLAGVVQKREKSPLDKIGIIEAPCLSHRTELDPFNPYSKKDPQISEKNLKIAYRTHLIATGDNDPMNAVIDWTTMKAVSFFSMHLLSISSANREDNIVHSLSYYGGVPQGHFYTITTRWSSPYIFLYSGLYRSVMKEIDLGSSSKDKVVSWIYATSYNTVYFPQPLNEKGTATIKLISLNSSPIIATAHPQMKKLEFQRISKFELTHQYLQLGQDPSNAKSHLETIYEIDSLYLALYNRGNSIILEPAPIYWEFCQPPRLQNPVWKLYDEYLMLYGRFMSCPILDRSFYKFSQIELDENLAGCKGGLNLYNPAKQPSNLPKINETVVFCKMVDCTKSTLLHYFDGVKSPYKH